jgi:hypothetical protein
MDQAASPSVTERLDRLERDNRRLKRTRDTVLVGIAALFFMGHGAPAAKPVVGDQIALQAPGGLIRGEMSVGGDGSVRLVLYDPSRTPRFEVLSTPPDGAAALTLFDKDWRRRASLRLDNDGNPHLELYRADGKTVWAAP